MSMMQRRKGKVGERMVAGEIAALTGWKVARRVRQHDGDSDLVGVPGWSIEVKHYSTSTLGMIEGWWAQAVAQAQASGEAPLLVYKRQRGEWRAVWPMAIRLSESGAPEYWTDFKWAVESSLDAWASAAAEIGWPQTKKAPPSQTADEGV